jgi:hypothetical protein
LTTLKNVDPQESQGRFEAIKESISKSQEADVVTPTLFLKNPDP